MNFIADSARVTFLFKVVYLDLYLKSWWNQQRKHFVVLTSTCYSKVMNFVCGLSDFIRLWFLSVDVPSLDFSPFSGGKAKAKDRNLMKNAISFSFLAQNVREFSFKISLKPANTSPLWVLFFCSNMILLLTFLQRLGIGHWLMSLCGFSCRATKLLICPSKSSEEMLNSLKPIAPAIRFKPDRIRASKCHRDEISSKDLHVQLSLSTMIDCFCLL